MLCSSSMLILILVFCLHFHFKGTVDSLVFILIQNKSRISQQCSVFWSSDNNSLSHPCRRCRLIPAQTSTGPKSNGGMFPASAGAILVTVPSHLTSGGVLIISYHPILLCFTASPPLHIHVNQSFILSSTSESWGWAQHITQLGTVSAPGFGWTDSPGASVTLRCQKQGQHSSDHTRL